MGVWRLLNHGAKNAFMNMAIDEAVHRARIENLVPNTIRFYRWKPSAVSVGRFQRIGEEVQLANCRKQGVNIIRRVSGGGAVYHDTDNEITYSVIVKKEDLEAQDITLVYERISKGLIETLRILGLTADFSKGKVNTCPNVMINGKKISGSAQAHKRGVVLQHGTLLLDVNFVDMFTFLRVQWPRSCMEVVNVAKRNITSLKEELRRDVSREEMKRALTDGFQKGLNIELMEDKLTSYESELAERLSIKKYATRHWNFCGKTVPNLIC